MMRHVPNILTCGRLVLTIVLLIMILYSPQVEEPALFLDIAFVIFVITGLTDVVDGHLARRFNVTSKFGRIMDPLADKVLVCGTFICFALIGEPRLYDLSDRALAVIHWSVAGILILRETYVTVLRQWAEYHGINFAATKSGKIKMFLQAFAIGTVLVKMAHVPTALWGYCFTSTVFLLMVGATVISGIRASMRDTSLQGDDWQPKP
jgi:CDP-diacylglycerol---glycerol-3-phosphate 3-phosphatidyltransferase